MFGEQIGKIEQPLENILVEEARKPDGTREIFVTISMRDLPSTQPIAVGVAHYAASSPKIGSILVDSPDRLPLNFERSFDDYIAEVKRQEVGKITAGVTYDFLKIHTQIDLKSKKNIFGSYGPLCVGTNILTNSEAEVNLWYLLMMHMGNESAFSVSQLKSLGHPKRELGRQGVMGYSLAGDEQLMEEAKGKIVSITAEQPSTYRGILTFNDVAYMKEALAEFKFQTARKFGK